MRVVTNKIIFVFCMMIVLQMWNTRTIILSFRQWDLIKGRKEYLMYILEFFWNILLLQKILIGTFNRYSAQFCNQEYLLTTQLTYLKVPIKLNVKLLTGDNEFEASRYDRNLLMPNDKIHLTACTGGNIFQCCILYQWHLWRMGCRWH